MSDPTLEMIRGVYAAYERGDVVSVLPLLADDVEVVQTDALPWGGVRRGVEGMLHFLGALRRHVDSRVEIQHLYAAGDRVVMVGRTRGVARQTGRAFDVHAVHLWSVAGGRIQRYAAYIDTPAMLRAVRA